MMKFKHILSLIGVAGILLLPACSDDNNTGVRSSESLKLSVNIDALKSGSTTRAAIPPQEGETDVESLHLFFFTAAEDRSGTLQGIVSLDDGINMETTYVLPASGTIDPASAYHIIGVANAARYINGSIGDWNANWDGQTEAYFRENALGTIAGIDNDEDYTSNAIPSSALFMNGYVEKAAGEHVIQMMLTRNVSRLDVKNSIDGYNMMSVSVWNAFTKSSITGDAMLNYSSLNTDERTRRFYGVKPSSPVTAGESLKGALYAFENYSESPQVNDNVTTTLIIGLQPEGGGATAYYRANVNAAGAAQQLKRNYAYTLTLLSVSGDGYDTEGEAYEGTKSQLNYLVNYWDLDDNGLVVSDEYSILAVPVKTVKIGAGGGEYAYTITTFSTLENPAPLKIKSQTYDPAGKIEATLTEQTLTIKATPMDSGEELRSGLITVSFAGLESSINVVQTPSNDIYLEVTLDDAWEETLAPTVYSMSEFIYVKASGPYTIELYGNTGYFGIKNILGQYVTRLSSAELVNNKFHIYTIQANSSTSEANQVFAMITLDEDPANYVSVVTLKQATTGGITTNPANLSKLVFHGNGDLNTSGSMADGGVTNNTFEVASSGAVSYAIAGTNYDKFNVTYNESTSLFTVTAKGANATMENYTASLVLTNTKNGYTLIELVQTPLELTVTPSVTTTDAKGADISFSWNIEYPQPTVTVEVTTEGVNDIVVNHEAYVTNSHGNVITNGIYTDETTLTLHVPKIYYANRERDVKVTVKVTTGTGISKSFEVEQSRLYARWDLRAISSTTGYGSILQAGHYINAFREEFLKITTIIQSYAPSSPSQYGFRNFINFNNHNSFDNSPLDQPGYSWDGIVDWINGDHGLIMVVADYHASSNFIANMRHANSPFGADFVVANNRAGSKDPSVGTTSEIMNSRVYEYLMNHTKSKITSAVSFPIDGTHTEVASWPAEAVQIIPSADDNSRAMMLIDPKRRTIYIGDGQMFDTTTNSNRLAFIRNVAEYIELSMKYGSHFTDMLVDWDSNDPEYVAAPWDVSVWGANAMP